MTHHLSPARAHTRFRSRRSGAFRPALEVLEDRLTPASVSWAIEADPEGYVYHDVNGNGAFDASESAVGAGWAVYVDANENGILDTGEINTTTDATGHYSIVLPDGTYSIRVIPQSGFQDDRLPFGTLVHDFASVESGSNPDGSSNYSGLAWVNGSLYVTQTRQVGVADNVMYQVDPQTGAALGPSVSIPGQVSEITYDGTAFWGADYINDQIIRFNYAGQELQRLSFAGMDINSVEWDGAALRVLDIYARRIYRIDPAGSGTILGYINTPNEYLLGLAFDGTSLWVNGRDSAQVYALDPTTGAVERSFAGPGPYSYGLAIHGTSLWLSQNRQSRVFQFDLGYGTGRIVTVAGADVTGVNLAVFHPASIAGRVFSDNNHNGVQDPTDGGVPGWRLYLDANGNGQYDPWEKTTLTDAGGNYTFSDLGAGSYTVAQDLTGELTELPHWSQTAPSSGTYTVTVAHSGEVFTGRNFGNYLDRVNPAKTDWATTDGGKKNLYTGLVWVNETAAGGGVTYTYSGATVGADNSTRNGYLDWRLPTKVEAVAAAVEQQAGAQAGFPNTARYWTSTAGTKHATHWVVSLGSPTGEAISLVDGYSWYLAIVRDTATSIDDGSAGYTDTGWTSKSESTSSLGDYRTKAAGNGSQTATWTFTGLEVGASYKVAVTWKAVSGNASNAPYTVLDGTATEATVAVNQQVSPSDFSIADLGWKGIGTYTIDSGTLTVRLSNQANGAVIADAVRVFRVYPSFPAGNPLLADGGAVSTNIGTQTLTTAELSPILQEALSRWESTGLSAAQVAALESADVRIADLGGSYLGLQSGSTVWIDDNAAGWGWFVDPTPHDDSEYTTPGNQGEQNRMDLLTVVMHEFGHFLGLDHDDEGVMQETLAAGERHLPVQEESPALGPITLGSTAATPLAPQAEGVSVEPQPTAARKARHVRGTGKRHPGRLARPGHGHRPARPH